MCIRDRESNSGGTFGLSMALQGIKALVLEGKSEEPCIININEGNIEFFSANDYRGLGAIETGKRLREDFGDKIDFLCLGPTGERMLLASAIVVSDQDGVAARHLGRGGLGAVMGSKNVKAIVINSSRRYKKGANPKELKGNVKEYLKLLATTKQTSEIYTKFGTAAMVDTTNALEGMPTNNFRYGSHEKASQINGISMRKMIEKREGNISHACMPGCTRCV